MATPPAAPLDGLWSPQRIADEAVERTVSRLGARKISTRHAPVLFHPDTAAGLWGHLVMAISGATSIASRASCWTSWASRSCPSGSPFRSSPTCWGLASTPFDGEGRTRDLDIVRDGELMSWLAHLPTPPASWS